MPSGKILSMIGIYTIYSEFHGITANIEQLPSVFSHFILGGLIGYFLERSRRGFIFAMEGNPGTNPGD